MGVVTANNDIKIVSVHDCHVTDDSSSGFNLRMCQPKTDYFRFRSVVIMSLMTYKPQCIMQLTASRLSEMRQ